VENRQWKKESDFGQTFGLVTLALLHNLWPLYIINNEHGSSISDIWDGPDLKLSFRKKSISSYIMMLWYDLIYIIESVNLVEENDRIIWSFCSKGMYPV
jgi:hypothetical protein